MTGSRKVSWIRWLIVVLVGIGFRLQGATVELNIAELGAINDSTVLSTAVVQRAIDSCYFSGGGKVIVPKGDFLIGTIVLKSRVNLHLEKGATLHASRDINDYRIPLEDAYVPTLIYANGADSVAITGEGLIHGHAEREYRDLEQVDRMIKDITQNARQAGIEMKQYYRVPPHVSLLVMSRSSNVYLQGVHFKESTYWTIHLVRCSEVIIDRLTVTSSLEKGVNADGIDINSSRNVVIRNCKVSTGDDAIAIKSWYQDSTTNISVVNCEVSSSSTALKIGTETYGPISDIRFQNCIVKDANRGLSIVMRNGGSVDNVLFENIEITCSRRHFNWWGNGEPIHLAVMKKADTTKLGSISNVRFKNINARAMGTSTLLCPQSPTISNIQFENFKLKMYRENYADKRATHALVFDNVKQVSLKNTTIDWARWQKEPKWGSAIVAAEVTGLEVKNFAGSAGHISTELPIVKLVNVQDAVFANCLAKRGTENFVWIEGDKSQRIALSNIDVRQACEMPLKVAADVVESNTIELRNP